MLTDITIIPIRFGRGCETMPSPAALSLAAALGAAGLSWAISVPSKDARFGPFSPETVCEVLSRTQSPSIALSIFHDAVPVLIAALDRLGPHLDDKRIFLGGPGVVGIPSQLMARLPIVEATVVGEGETALVKLIKERDSAATLPGVYTRVKESGLVSGFGRTRREDVNALPALPWHAVARNSYDSIPLSTMRGCPFGCKFCEVEGLLGKRVTMMNLDLALDSLESALACFPTQCVSILDDTFTLSRKRVFEFCGKLLKRGLNIKFTAYSRTDTIDVEMMAALKDAGCDRLFFGLDAGDQETLRKINKGINLDAAIETVLLASEHFSVVASFIWGYPFETLQSVKQTLELSRKLAECGRRFRIVPQLHLLAPSIETPLYQEFGHDLILDTESDLLPLCDAIRSYRHTSGFEPVMRVIQSERLLSAAYYRYRCPDFAHKATAVKDFDDQLCTELGQELTTIMEGETHGIYDPQ